MFGKAYIIWRAFMEKEMNINNKDKTINVMVLTEVHVF